MQSIKRIFGRFNKWGLAIVPVFCAVAGSGASNKWG